MRIIPEFPDEEIETVFKYCVDNSINELRNYLERNNKMLGNIPISKEMTAHEKYFSEVLKSRWGDRWGVLNVLTIACWFASKEMVEMLILDFKLNLKEPGIAGLSCFAHAVCGNKHETMKYLNSLNPKLCQEMINDYFGASALMLASQFSDIETIKLLIDEYNEDIKKLDSEGRNCFHWAVYGEKTDNMKYLHSLDPNLWKNRTISSHYEWELTIGRGGD